MKLARCVTAAAALIALSASSASAQTFTTSNIASWNVCVRQLPTSGECNNGSFGAAKNAGLAGGWSNSNTWITGQGGPSYGSVNGENPLWEITYRTTLNSLHAGVGSITASSFYLDNYFARILFNGAVVAPTWNNGVGYAGTPLAANGQNWTRHFGFDLSGLNFNAGDNVLDIVITGNGRTDAMAVMGSYNVVSTPVITPEPSTYAFMVAGLAAVGLFSRRRRSV